MSPDQARQQIAFIRSQIEGGADGGILDTNTLHGLLFHAERGLEAAAEIERLTAALKEIADMPPLQSVNAGAAPTIYDAEQRIARAALDHEQSDSRK